VRVERGLIIAKDHCWQAEDWPWRSRRPPWRPSRLCPRAGSRQGACQPHEPRSRVRDALYCPDDYGPEDHRLEPAERRERGADQRASFTFPNHILHFSRPLQELFAQTVGPVKNVTLTYDSNGKSKGLATVIFQKASDGAKAFQQYNNRLIDGS
jgi:hypothetical protein